MGDIAEAHTEKTTVLVTGFGPFGNHVINASWVAVQELQKLGLGDHVNLITEEIPVRYKTVSTALPQLWTKYNPKLVVHVGVSGIAKELTLEQQAHNDGYDKDDVDDFHPDNKCCIDGASECLLTQLDMKGVAHAVNSQEFGVKAVVSFDPGRYLCDFTYFTSLSIDQCRSAFIHVPPLDKPYTAAQLASALQIAIQHMLTQL